MKTIYLDMDGTFANLYGVPNWLEMLEAEDTTPYEQAPYIVNNAHLARLLNAVQCKGYDIGIISWLPKHGSAEYNRAVTKAKQEYLRKHFPSVAFNKIIIVPYGTPKNTFNSGFDYLIDDEAQNLEAWSGEAYPANRLIEVLQEILRG